MWTLRQKPGPGGQVGFTNSSRMQGPPLMDHSSSFQLRENDRINEAANQHRYGNREDEQRHDLGFFDS